MDNSKKETPEKPAEEIKPGPLAAAKTSADKPAKTGLSIWARLLRWLLGILILLGLGALAVVMLLYLPTRDKLEEAQQKLETLTQQSSSDLQTANQEIERLSTVESDFKDLQTRLADANLLAALRQIRLDVLNAQLALANEDPAQAKTALSGTGAAIDKLKDLLPQAQLPAVESLQARLKLVLEELEENAFAANSDLQVMNNTLLELENALNR